MTGEPSDDKWSVDRLLEVREREVLPQYPTDLGPLEPYFAHHGTLPPVNRADEVLRTASAHGRTIVQPRHGVTLIEDQIGAMGELRAAGGDILSVLTDPYTRQLQFDNADGALAESREQGRSMISGYPVASYGVEATREIVASLDRPCSVRMASQDSRLSKEIYLAAGFTYMFMGPVQNLAYEKDASPESLIANYQYEDRLIGFYEDNGCPVVKELPATLTGTLVPPCIAVTSTLIDAMLAVKQGVRRVVVSYGLLGNPLQDVAAIRVLRELANRYLAELGDVEIYVVTPQWMGDFPQDPYEAYAVITENALLAGLGGSDMVISKSLDEGFGVPSREANIKGVQATRQALDLVAGQRMELSGDLEREMDVIRRSVAAILDQVWSLGDGDLARGTAAAIRGGIIDVPFSPNRYNADLSVPARDVTGAVRWLEPGNIPLPDDIRTFHADRIRERSEATGTTSSYQFVVDDVLEFSRRLGPLHPRTPNRHQVVP